MEAFGIEREAPVHLEAKFVMETHLSWERFLSDSLAFGGRGVSCLGDWCPFFEAWDLMVLILDQNFNPYTQNTTIDQILVWFYDLPWEYLYHQILMTLSVV